MNIEDAIKTAIEYELKVCELYREVELEMKGETSSRLIKALYTDEKNHVKYLEDKLRKYLEDGSIVKDEIISTLPSKEELEEEICKLKTNMTGRTLGDNKKILSKLLKAEIETSRFYRQMVDDLPDEGKGLFSRFLEIEDAHIDLVQAELDLYGNTGFWFDNKEIDMESLGET